MALRDAVLMVLKKMKESRDFQVQNLGYSELSDYVGMLEMSLVASEGEASGPRTAEPILSHRDLIEREKLKLRMSREKAASEEDLETTMMPVVGGDLDGSMVPVTGSLQEGGAITINGQTYRKESDGCLHPVS